MKRLASCLLVLSASLVACENKPKTEPTPTPVTSASAAAAAAKPKLAGVPRPEFNALAAELALPLFWIEDKNKDGALDPEELAVYWGLDKTASLRDYVKDGAFTQKMTDAYDRIVKQKAKGEEGGDARVALVKKELRQGRVTLVETDLTKGTDQEKAFTRSMLKVADLVEALYAKQQATTELAAKVTDPASKTLFFRGQGPKCEAPATQDDPNCGALPMGEMPKTKLSGMYPADLLAANPKFCETMQAKKDKQLLDPFTVVVKDDKNALVAKPYTEVWASDMKTIATELETAAGAVDPAKEAALKTYLLAAAKSFTDNNWWPADEAWAKMDANNSKFFVRIAPDEVYDEPCSTKALFHLTFALVNQGAVKWQKKLDPLKTEMESALAELAGAPYKARSVTFKLPDFIDIAINAGDSRKAFGATIGQSLPNFGPVANEGRGRTVAMTNFYTDPDSIAASKSQAESLFCGNVMTTRWTDSPDPQLMSTVLHEASHNLGPAHQYKANGKIDREAFGGPLASTLEELKAQTAALYFADWLAGKNEITADENAKAKVRDMFWAFGHISRGMYDKDKHPKNYSQLAAIQVGWLMKEKALMWREAEPAANGKDKGCFDILNPIMPGAIKLLMTEVAQIKAKGDKAKAEALIKEYVDVTGDKKKVLDTITERMTRAAKASFVYSVRL